MALVGCTSFALAQQEEHGGSAAKPGAAQQQKMAPGGATGHAQAPGAMERKEQAPGGAAQNEERGKTNENAQTEERGKTDQNAQSQEPNKTQDNAQTQGNKTQENAQTQERGGANQSTAQGKAGGGKSVQLSETQRTQIKGVIVKDRDVARVNNVNFDINVGVAVPSSVHVVVLPAEIVTIVPEYRGFDYVIVGNQLLIIDPNTMLIVEVLPV